MSRFHNWKLMVLSLPLLALLSCGGDSGGTSTPSPSTPMEESRNLHVASPDWRDQVIYFLMIDRFNDGDPDNNDQQGFYRPASSSHYSGGDLQGIIEQIPYIKGLGATAVWITPPVANQWWDPVNNFSGYHGYWARHHQQVDEHYGTIDEYKDLSHALHNNDMYLIQDIVPNHVGNYFHYTGAYNRDDTSENFAIIRNNVPVMAPIQSPFDLNDRNNPAHVMADIYHWTPHISNFGNQVQEFTYQLANLDDVNTDNPVVVQALKESFGFWITEVGVDGFRVDTVKFIDHPFWNEFFHGSGGIEETARSTGRNDFLHFGEVFEISPPMSNTAEIKIASFEGTESVPELDSLIGFPLYGEIGRVFADGLPPSNMRYRLEQHMTAYRDPYIVPNFIDNHDVGRFLSGSTPAGLRQALATIFTIPGIPVVWQGTEQSHMFSRRSMFAGGNAGINGMTNENDFFSTDSEMYEYIKELAGIRTGDLIWTRGDLEVLDANTVRPGSLVWRRSMGDDHAFVVMNTGEGRVLLNLQDIGITTAGTILTLLSGQTRTDDVVLNNQGAMVLDLAPREILLLQATDQIDANLVEGPTITVTTDIAGQTISEGEVLSGTVTPASTSLQLVIDGDLSNAVAITPDASGAWSAAIPSSLAGISEEEHVYQLYDSASMTVTNPVSFMVPPIEFTGMAMDFSDPMDDDNGPTGMYTYPQDSTFSRQQDITGMSIETTLSFLRITFTMREISTVWNPTNGFDHVSFHIYFDLPDSEGIRVMPEQQGQTPEGFLWDIAQRTYGWENQIFSSTDATATTRGETLLGAPEISADEENLTVTFTYNGARLGVDSWNDVKIYATTWDIDGIEDVLRDILPNGAQWQFGGALATDPKIMDSAGPVTIASPSTAGVIGR